MNYKTLKKSIENKGYVFFDLGNLNLNFIWVRNDMNADNHFTDDLFIAYKENNQEQVLLIKCTTVPGLKKSLYDPNTVEGITGTAVIRPGQYRGSWQFIDSFEDFSKYPFFRQIKPIDYWRDGDKDNVIDVLPDNDLYEAVKIEDKIFGTHWHKMSNVGDKRNVQDFEINNWSQGCLGAPVVEWDKVISLTRKAIKLGQSNKFTGTIIDAKDILK